MRIVCLVLLLIVAAGNALAHKPIFTNDTGIDPNNAIKLIDPNISQVVYRELPLSAQLWTTFTASADFEMFVQIGVPVIDRLKQFRPSLAVIGPGLPDVNLPFALPRGLGAVIIDTNSVEPKFFHEHFTGTDSWILTSRTIKLPQGGRFYVTAFDPASKGGKLWIAVGKKEKFGLADFFTFGQTKKRVRQFHEVDVKSGHNIEPNSKS